MSNCLLRASDGQLTISANNPFASKQSTIPARVFEAGDTTVPLDQFLQIISGAPKGQPINLVVKDRAAITWGRSRYGLGVLPVSDFPAALSLPVADAILLDDDTRADLFERPAQVLLADGSNPLFAGVYLHEIAGHLSSLGSDGIRLFRPSADASIGHRPPVSVHKETALEIDRMRADRVWWDGRYIAASVGNNTLTASLLAGAAYGEYSATLPDTDCAPIIFDRKELAAALKRLSTMATHGSVVRLKFGNAPRTAILEFVAQEGSEVVTCQGDGLSAGYVGFAPIRLAELIEILGGEQVKFYIKNPSTPIRIVADSEPHTLVVIATCRVTA